MTAFGFRLDLLDIVFPVLRRQSRRNRAGLNTLAA
jgi:hypothetical protein